MAELTSASAGPAALLRDHFQDILDSYLENRLLAADLMDSQVFPANRGTTVEFHRLNTLPKQLTGISEAFGSAHSSVSGLLKGEAFTIDNISTALQLIGNDLEITEFALMTAEPNPVPALSRLFLYNAADTLDQIYVNGMVSDTQTGTTQTSTTPGGDWNGSSDNVNEVWGDGSATLTEATLDADITSHKLAAETFNTAYGTLADQGGEFRSGNLYDCLIDPLGAADLRTDATYQEIALTGTKRGEDKFERAMLGEVFGTRVMVSQNVNVNEVGVVDANDTIIRSPYVSTGYASRISHAKGVGKPRVRFIPPAPSHADPYGNVGIFAWKSYFAMTVTHVGKGLVLKYATTRNKNVVQADDSTWE